jgi:hypothetical protein
MEVAAYITMGDIGAGLLHRVSQTVSEGFDKRTGWHPQMPDVFRLTYIVNVEGAN